MIVFFVSATAMLFHGILFLYYIFLASTYIRPPAIRHIYYTTSIIPLNTLTMYGFNLILYGFSNKPINGDMLTLFFIEWCITCPLFIINVSRLVAMKLSRQLLLTSLTICVNMLGFISHRIVDRTIKFQLYGAACTLFLGLCINLLYHYHIQSQLYYNNNPHIKNTTTVFKLLVKLILGTWSLYPIAFLVYELGNLSHEQIILTFTCLDFISKGCFTSILIGYYEHTYRRNSIVSFLTRNITRIAPVTTDDIVTESSIQTIQNSVQYSITDTIPRRMSV